MEIIAYCLIAPFVLFLVGIIVVAWVIWTIDYLKSDDMKPVGVMMVLAPLCAIGMTLLMYINR